MSQLSKVTYSRHQWKHKATQRADRERYQRTQTARIRAERDRTTQALQAAQARRQQREAPLRQREAPLQRQVSPPKVEVVLVSLHLF
jgi:septal ring factor EnvC (AmiA/AmiB activator)